jgi:hypothetical protein
MDNSNYAKRPEHEERMPKKLKLVSGFFEDYTKINKCGYLHFQCRRINQATSQHEAGLKQMELICSCVILVEFHRITERYIL